MRKFIVPVDFSSYSENALKSAIKIADKTGSSITAIHVINTTLVWDSLSEQEKEKFPEIRKLQEDASPKLERFISQCKHKDYEVAVDSKVMVGLPAPKILEAEKNLQADLIVIGAYGSDHKAEKFIGSNFQNILRKAFCPVLAVKKVISGHDLKKIAFASRFNEAGYTSFTRLLPLVKQLDATVHFLYINTPDNFIDTSEAKNLMQVYHPDDAALRIKHHVESSNEVEKGIEDFCKANKLGLVAVASRDRAGTSSYQIGITESTIFKTDLAVLSLKFE